MGDGMFVPGIGQIGRGGRRGLVRTPRGIPVLTGAYMSYEGPRLANENSRKLGVFHRKLEGNHSIFYQYFDKY